MLVTLAAVLLLGLTRPAHAQPPGGALLSYGINISTPTAFRCSSSGGLVNSIRQAMAAAYLPGLPATSISISQRTCQWRSARPPSGTYALTWRAAFPPALNSSSLADLTDLNVIQSLVLPLVSKFKQGQQALTFTTTGVILRNAPPALSPPSPSPVSPAPSPPSPRPPSPRPPTPPGLPFLFAFDYDYNYVCNPSTVVPWLDTTVPTNTTYFTPNAWICFHACMAARVSAGKGLTYFNSNRFTGLCQCFDSGTCPVLTEIENTRAFVLTYKYAAPPAGHRRMALGRLQGDKPLPISLQPICSVHDTGGGHAAKTCVPVEQLDRKVRRVIHPKLRKEGSLAAVGAMVSEDSTPHVSDETALFVVQHV